MKLANNIKYYRKRNKLTQADLASKLGVAPTAISAWEVGRNKPLMDKIEMMSELFGIRKSDLIGDDFSPINLVMFDRESVVRVPILGTIKCGQPILAEDNITGYREELSDRLPSGNLFYLRSQGDSMLPTIPEGSLVLIREQPTVEYGEVAAVLVNGDTEATLKRVKKQGDIVMLIADNPDYPPYIITDDNPARIIGKAVQVSVDL